MFINHNGLTFQSGFHSFFETEAREGALPVGRNSPQNCPFDLYAEQLSGSAFTTPRHQNFRSWLYRILPSVVEGKFAPYDQKTWKDGAEGGDLTPNQQRWDAHPYPDTPTHFVDGVYTMVSNGSAQELNGIAAHTYVCNADMNGVYFYNSDAEMLIVPQEGELRIFTEMGILSVKGKDLAVIPRGVKFSVSLPDGKARGYICENYGMPFILPGLGPIGANGLANPRDFITPVAAFEEKTGDFKLVTKFAGNLWAADIGHSPLDVVAWHGNYAPYQYDMTRFNTIGTVSFDHPDPSIFTVLTSPSGRPGVANCDFAIFPPRWMVGEDTFRPPWFHRNIMSEFMGLVHGEYDAKAEGFVPGGASVHNCMTPHGPDGETFEKATQAELTPQKIDGTLAFMFESNRILAPTEQAMKSDLRQPNYPDCWQTIKANYK